MGAERNSATGFLLLPAEKSPPPAPMTGRPRATARWQHAGPLPPSMRHDGDRSRRQPYEAASAERAGRGAGTGPGVDTGTRARVPTTADFLDFLDFFDFLDFLDPDLIR